MSSRLINTRPFFFLFPSSNPWPDSPVMDVEGKCRVPPLHCKQIESEGPCVFKKLKI
jgi:hypothetical protein